MASIAQFCERMRMACEEWSLGYDQSNRYDIRDGGECDCSSLVIWALGGAGFDTGDASYTGNMSDELCARGWRRIPFDFAVLQPGDILLNDVCHTCAVISGYGYDAIIAQASIDERGRISGGESGDQTGGETNTRRVYMYSRGWDCILRYSGADSGANSGESGTNAQKLAIDGYLGRKSVAEWQRQMGTTVDGVVSGQWPQLADHYSRLTSVDFGDDGSWLIAAVQRRLGVFADGVLGPETIKAIQRFVGVEPDGYLGPNTAKAIQRSLNEGRWG